MEDINFNIFISNKINEIIKSFNGRSFEEIEVIISGMLLTLIEIVTENSIDTREDFYRRIIMYCENGISLLQTEDRKKYSSNNILSFKKRKTK